MKKLFITLSAVIMALSLNATTKVLFNGSETAHHVSWDTPLNLESTKFADVLPGNILKVQYTNAANGLELKVWEIDNFLVGYDRTEPVWISGEGSYEMILSTPAIASLQANGLQIKGAGFDCTMVEVLDGEVENLKGGDLLWKGYFWMDSWCTKTIYIKGFNDWSKYKELRVYHEANRTNYVINVLSQFEKDGAKVPDNAITKEDTCAVVDLTKVNMADIINASNDKNTLLVQMNKETGAAFNMTDIVLVPKDDPSGIEQTNANAKAIKSFRNGMLVIEKNGKFYNALGVEVK